MIISLMDGMSSMLYASLWLTLAGSFLWGIASVTLSPCHLSSIPLVMGFIAKESRGTQGRAFLLSTVFTLGIFLSMLALGLITAALGRLLGDVGSWTTWLGAGIFVLVGLMLLDVVSMPKLSIGNQDRFRGGGLPAALALGMLFGTVLGPCAFAFLMPVLGLVFAQAAERPFYAAGLVTAYAMGHGAVIVLAGSASVWTMGILNNPRNSRWIYGSRKVAGMLCLGIAVWFVTK
jgi:cytochrome c-type biogenesis protein